MFMSNHEMAERYKKKSKLMGKDVLEIKLVENDGVELIDVLDKEDTGRVVIPSFITKIGYRKNSIKAPLLGCKYTEVYIDNKRDLDISNLCSYMNSDSIKISSKDNGSMLVGIDNLFSNSEYLGSIDIRGISGCNINSLDGVFKGCISLRDINGLKELNVRNVVSIKEIFNGCTSLKHIRDIELWSTSKLKNISGAFKGTGIEELGVLKKWDTSNISRMSEAFMYTDIKDVDGISKWDTSKVVDMSGLFMFCEKLCDIKGIKNWNTGNVKNMENMINECEMLEDIDSIGGWDIRKVSNMKRMFKRTKVRNLKVLSGWETSELVNINGIFSECENLERLDGLESWDMSKVEYISSMFDYCIKLKDISGILGWDLKGIKDRSSFVMIGCKSLSDESRSIWLNKLK